MKHAVWQRIYALMIQQLSTLQGYKEQAINLNNANIYPCSSSLLSPRLKKPDALPPAYKNKIIIGMQAHTPPNSQILLRQFISEAHVSDAKQRRTLKEHFKKKLSHHINMLQFHQLREDRFIISQKKILEKQNQSIEKAKEFLDLRMQKANSIKNHHFVERSKRAEEEVSKWESIVSKNKERSERELEQSKVYVKQWNQKLSESCNRKSTRLDGISKNLKEKMSEKERKFHSLRIRLDQTAFSNPQNIEKGWKRPKKKQNLQKKSMNNERVPTQSFVERRKKHQQQLLKESIIKTVNKQERISQARYTRQYLQQRKKKMNSDKSEMMKMLRNNNLTSMKGVIQQRNQLLERKYTLQKSSSKEKQHIKKGQDVVSMKAIINRFGQQNEKDYQGSINVSPNRNYDKMMTQKLKEISLLMRKKKSQ